MRHAPIPVLVCLAILILTTPAAPQWVEFVDETATRLVLSTVTTNDAEEKDVAVGDLDQDGWLDIIVVRKVPFSNPGARSDVLLMNQNGILTDRTADLAPEFLTIPTDARDVLITDLTGDGWRDVVICNTFNQQPQFYRNLGSSGGVWQGLVNESSSRFPFLEPPGQSGGPLFCAVTAGDLDGNNAKDLFFSNYNGEMTEDRLLINDGTGHFTNETASRLGNYANVAFGSGSEIHDVNDDGYLDIIKLSTLYSVPPWNQRGIYILFNDGSGNFDTAPWQRLNESDPYMFTCAHLTDDDIIDIYIVSDNQDQLATATSINMDGTVNYSYAAISSSPRTGGFGGNVKAADIDGDGDLDIGACPVDVDIQNCSGGQAGEFALLRNNGGSLSDPYSGTTKNFHQRPHDFGFLDIDNNGCLDMFMAKCTGWDVFMQYGAQCVAASSEGVRGDLADRATIQASPNPFRASTTVFLGLPPTAREGRIDLQIYDAIGARVRTLYSGDAATAPAVLDWDGRDDRGRRVAADVYFLNLIQGENRTQSKVVMVR